MIKNFAILFFQYKHRMEKTLSLLVRQFNYELERIQDEETDNLNISQAFDGIGKFGEILTTTIFPGSIGSASKGGCAFDNHCLLTNKKREVKTCCIIQPKICNSCVQINKINLFSRGTSCHFVKKYFLFVSCGSSQVLFI